MRTGHMRRLEPIPPPLPLSRRNRRRAHATDPSSSRVNIAICEVEIRATVARNLLARLGLELRLLRSPDGRAFMHGRRSHERVLVEGIDVFATLARLRVPVARCRNGILRTKLLLEPVPT